MASQPRNKGKFERKRKTEWRENIIVANKKRKISPVISNKTVDIEGSRIMNIKTLAQNLWCPICNIPLSLREIQREHREGLASSFVVKCGRCETPRYVETCTQVQVKLVDRIKYSINFKAAAAVIDGGIGAYQLNTILSELNVPPIPPKTLKRYEKKIGKALENLANESCLAVIKEEKKLTLERNPSLVIKAGEPVPLCASADGAWPKRGSGFAYDSLSGVATAVGRETGKCLARGTRNKNCNLCRLGHTQDDHDCKRNWNKSAKAMEPDIAVEILVKNKQFERENVVLGTLIGDDDSSTIAAIRRESKHLVAKWSDVNHAQKQLSKALWSNKINRRVIDYIKYKFGCALKINKDDVTTTEQSLKTIISHAFDDHENCGPWCKYKDDPVNYKHKYLPDAKALTGDSLRTTLEGIMEKFWKNADKLTQCGSTQINESINGIIATKAPKNHHYGNSEAYNSRVDAAILQKNEGTSYVLELNKTCQLSPGKITQSYRDARDCVRARRAEKQRGMEYKRRRNELKKKKSAQRVSSQRKEGVTYSTACAMDRISEFVDESLTNKSIPADITYVYFDLETTGLSTQKAEICQIAAKADVEEFEVFIKPVNGIPKNIADLTGLSLHDDAMFYGDQQVNTLTLKTALQGFFEFLRRLGKPVILLAHNGNRFDIPLLVRDIRQTDCWSEFDELVCGVIDTYCLLKKLLPERRAEKKKFNQRDLTLDFLGPEATIGAHNALNDVIILQKIIKAANISDEQLRADIKSMSSLQKDLLTPARKKSLECLQDLLSKGMITKIAKAGISLEILQHTFNEKKDQGVRLLLREDVGGHPRVTNTEKIIDNVITGVKNSLEMLPNILI